MESENAHSVYWKTISSGRASKPRRQRKEGKKAKAKETNTRGYQTCLRLSWTFEIP